MEITGIYDKTLYRNEDNGYTIFSFATKELNEYKTEQGSLICMGETPLYTDGIPLKLEGEVFAKEDGESVFKIYSSAIFSDNKQFLINYLSSDVFNGIGIKTAEKIINLTGLDISSFIKKENAADLLRENVSELKEQKADIFIKTINSTVIQREIYELIACYGGKYTNAQKMYEKYGINSIKEFKKDPYLVGYESGISFLPCDIYAISQGFSPYDTKRLKSLAYRILEYNEARGNTYITVADFKKTLDIYCPKLASQEKVPVTAFLPIISEARGIVISYGANGIKIFKKSTWDNEQKIVSNIYRLLKSASRCPFNPDIIKQIEKSLNIKYSEEQKLAFNLLAKTGVKILTGGPGTGKSTVINGIIHAYKKMFPNNKIILTAPTGRAAQRMTEITNLPASTLHKVLDVHPYGDMITYKDLSNPIDADLIIVDETSMADTELTAMLLGAIKNNSLLVFCGDVDQLPSVGAGNVLNDLIESDKIEKYQLKKIFRQNSNSMIAFNAMNIKNGVPEIQKGEDTVYITVENEEELEKTVMRCFLMYNDKKDVFKTQILSTTKKGIGGTKNINTLIQEELMSGDASFSIDNCSYFVGDKVMTVKNNYEQGYYNGDIGIITDVTRDYIRIDINGQEVDVKRSDLKDISLCYASTTHKAQGAEFDTVIVVLPAAPNNMLQRNLFYTAVTRAKKKLIIIAEQNSAEYAIYNQRMCIRYTDLKNKLVNTLRN